MPSNNGMTSRVITVFPGVNLKSPRNIAKSYGRKRVIGTSQMTKRLELRLAEDRCAAFTADLGSLTILLDRTIGVVSYLLFPGNELQLFRQISLDCRSRVFDIFAPPVYPTNAVP